MGSCSHAVLVNPVVSIPGGSASFVCTTSIRISNDFIESVQWLVNDTLYEDLELDNVVVTAAGELRFSMISTDYNTTSIRCRATLTSGNVRTSEASLLLIQGLLVGQLILTNDSHTLQGQRV